jgi:hypothetical protein
VTFPYVLRKGTVWSAWAGGPRPTSSAELAAVNGAPRPDLVDFEVTDDDSAGGAGVLDYLRKGSVEKAAE